MMVFSRPSLRSARPRVPLAAALIALFACTTAHAGPPFQTDDPDPVAFRHFEMYAFELSDGTGKNAGGTALEAPAYEVNYGVVPNVQLHLVLPMTASFAPGSSAGSGPTNFGIGDSELGAKVRFVKETKHIPEVGIFPFFELPSGNADKGLGVGATWYRMPLWLQKSWGPEDRQWTSYGGGGEAVVPATGYKNYPFSGLLVQRQLSKKLTLGTELFGHGAEGAAATSTRAATMLDLGGIVEFKPGFDLLFAVGRSVFGQPETYTYLSFYWTWGPGGAGDQGDPAQPGSGTNSKILSALTKMRLVSSVN
jgi:hypothetical protein